LLDLWFDSLTILSSTLHFVPPFGPETSGSKEDLRVEGRLSIEGRLKQTLARLGRPEGSEVEGSSFKTVQ
jgi:hypothetical protein